MPKAKVKHISEQLKLPPHNIEAEQAILAGILINNEAINHVIDLLSPEDFYRDSHRYIYESMLELFHSDDSIDLITLSQLLDSKKLLDKVGGKEYLISLVEAVSTSAGMLHYARIVKDLSIRRKLINQCSIISDSCFHGLHETEELLDMAEQGIFNIAEEKIRDDFSSMKDVISRSFKKLESVAEHDGFITGIPTGYIDFNRYTAGLQPGELIIIAGRPGMGKTALAINVGYHAADKIRQGVAIFSLEMSKIQLGMRLLGMCAGINGSKLRTGHLSHSDWERLTEAADHLSELPIFIDDSSALSVLEIKAKCRRLRRKNDLALIIVDYLQLIQGRKSAESRQIEISEISRGLKALAKDMDVPVIAVSQLNRRVEERGNKRPMLSDLRESGAIEQDADIIMFIYRDEVYNPNTDQKNIAEITIAKHRNGDTGKFNLIYEKEFTRFRDYSLHDEFQ